MQCHKLVAREFAMLVAPGACSVGKLQRFQRYNIALPSTIAAKLTGVLWRRDL